MKNEIVLIVCWFGPLRPDFYFWLKSVEYNPTIDFLFFTDQDIVNTPVNFKVVKCNLVDIEKIAKEKVWNGCVISKPYKLCDYKPAYGEMFNDYIKNYVFWGHCDVDLIFGDIRHYFTYELLNKFDRFMSEGHFILYRNIPDVNSMYKNIDNNDYREVFTNQESYCFDEWRGATGYWVRKFPDRCFRNSLLMDDIQPNIYKFFSFSNRTKDKYKKNVMFSFDRGKLYKYYEKDGVVDCNETLYVHFQKRTLSIQTKCKDQYCIIPNKIVSFRKHISKTYLRWHIRESKFWPYSMRAIIKICLFLNIHNRYTKDNLIFVNYQ